MSREIDVVATGFAHLEGPRWRDGRLWVCDSIAGRVLTVDAGGAVTEVAKITGSPSALGWLPDERMLILSTPEILRLDASGEIANHADLSPLRPAGPLNDLVVGPTGRAYVSDTGSGDGETVRTTRMYGIDPDGEVSVASNSLYAPSGLVLMPDSTLLVAETAGSRLTAFDCGTDGSIVNRRVWAAFDDPATRDDASSAAVAPAGMCADIDGAVWVADASGNRVLRVREGGSVLDEISTGDLNAYQCMLGGDDGRTLYVCATFSSTEHDARGTGDAMLLAVRVDVPHGALP